MTVRQIQQLNENFQKHAVQLSELMPASSLAQTTSSLIRSSRRIHADFVKLLLSREESFFNQLMSRVEEEMDEVVFILDQLEMAYKKKQISLIHDFLKEGYGLMSIYSKCCDQVIGNKISEVE
ncbi:MAG: hypothetical protein AAF600_07590 [Bacteroidota bacterium]